MRQALATLRRDWRSILLQSVITTTVFLVVLFGVAYGLGGPQRDTRVDEGVQTILSYMEHGVEGRQHEHDVFLCLLTTPPANNGIWTEAQVRDCQTS